MEYLLVINFLTCCTGLANPKEAHKEYTAHVTEYPHGGHYGHAREESC